MKTKPNEVASSAGMKSKAKEPKKKATWETVAENLVRYNPSGTYFSNFRHNGGTPKKESLKTKDFASAKRLLAQRKADADKPKQQKADLQTLVSEFEKTITKGAKASQRKDGIFYRRMVEYFGGKVEIKELEFDLLEAFLNKRIEDGGKNSTYNEDLRATNALMEFAVRKHYLPDNPISHLKYLKRNIGQRDTPTEAEFKAILRAMKLKKCRDFTEFLGEAGVGNSEAANLQNKHLNFERGKIKLYRNKTREEYEIPMFESVRPLLERLYAASDKNPESYIFQVKQVKQSLLYACQRLQLPSFTHRSLRRMFIDKCLFTLDISPQRVGNWQGHTDNGATILKNYASRLADKETDYASRVV